MNTYTIREMQDTASFRKCLEVQAKDLSTAKRIASRNQMFQDTVLVIEQEGEVVATKEKGRWN